MKLTPAKPIYKVSTSNVNNIVIDDNIQKHILKLKVDRIDTDSISWNQNFGKYLAENCNMRDYCLCNDSTRMFDITSK